MRYNAIQSFAIGCILTGVWICTGCEVINPSETLPTTIKVEPFDFQVEDGQGSAMNKITEVWVYANNSFVGAFLPPAQIYYLPEGSTQFTFRPGIRNNGIANDAIVYPLFTGYTMTLNAAAGQVFEVQPITSYKPETTFAFLSDFELGNPFVDNRDTVAASKMVQSNLDVFEGQYSGRIVMSKAAHFIEVGHSIPISDLPADGTPVYLEFRYKSETEMSIGLLGIDLTGQSFSNFFYLVKPSENWNMLYIELTDLVKASALPGYKILFRSQYPSGGTQDEYNIYLDNIKVVHL